MHGSSLGVQLTIAKQQAQDLPPVDTGYLSRQGREHAAHHA